MNPIKIMDEIGDLFCIDETDWQSLRAAVEAQSEELAQAKANTCLPDDYVMIPVSEWQHMVDTEQELAQARARIVRLEQAARNVTECFAIQVPVYLEKLEAALNESPAQSLAAIKAEALREFANRKRQEAGRCDGVESMSQRTRLEREAESADKEADRIEREAEESHNGH